MRVLGIAIVLTGCLLAMLFVPAMANAQAAKSMVKTYLIVSLAAVALTILVFLPAM